MKNSSWKHPFPTFTDKMFDGNKDGKLNAIETAFRDAHIEEMSRNAASQQSKPKSSCYISADLPNTDENQQPSGTHTPAESIISQLLLICISIISCVGGLVLAFIIEGGIFERLLIIIGAISLSLLSLRLAGVYK